MKVNMRRHDGELKKNVKYLRKIEDGRESERMGINIEEIFKWNDQVRLKTKTERNKE